MKKNKCFELIRTNLKEWSKKDVSKGYQFTTNTGHLLLAITIFKTLNKKICEKNR